MAKLEAGSTAPAFTLPDQDGKPVKLSDFKGQQVIVYFYPADDTPGCTKEACEFTRTQDRVVRGGRLGMPRRGREAHQVPREVQVEVSAPHRCRQEGNGEVRRLGEKTEFRKKTMGTIRSTFLVGPTGKIQRAWSHVRADGHAAKVLEAISEG